MTNSKINWFPGHMTKALKEMKSILPNIDVILYVLDSRAPISSINPSLNKLAQGKKILYVFNKLDMADEGKVKTIAEKFKTNESDYLCINSTMSGASNLIKNKILALVKEKIEKYKQKGIKTTIRAMVVGIPNSGKSTLINNLCGKAKTITGNKPGVTKGMQWLNIGNNIEICDTPGTLYPNLNDQEVAKKLAFIGSIKDNVIDQIDLANDLISILINKYKNEFEKRYNGAKTLEEIATKRGYVVAGGEKDIERTAVAVIDDFRKCRIGRITLD